MGNERTSTNSIIVVQGAQYGSESKGQVAAALCDIHGVDYAVRTGTVNAGHTVLYKGERYKMQQLPTAWVWPNVALIIGPGAYIHPGILAAEIEMVNKATGTDIRMRLFVDYRCGLHMPYHTKRSSESGRHHSMGATGKGCSEAVTDKIMKRGSSHTLRLFSDWLDRAMSDRDYDHNSILFSLNFVDTAEMLNVEWDAGAKLLVEGTQGTMLDLHLGPYPYTTHKQTQVGNWMAEAGLSPSLPVEVALVARTYPIRVAGNSGPLRGEIGWTTLARRINDRLAHCGLPPRVQEFSLVRFDEACESAMMHFADERSGVADSRPPTEWKLEDYSQEQREWNPRFVSELHKRALDTLPPAVVDDLSRIFEMTTVTNKLRRVAEMDLRVLNESVFLNRPAYIVLTFVNYLFPEIWDCPNWETMGMVAPDTVEGIEAQTSYLCEVLGTKVRYISTGPATEHVLEVPK